MSIPLSGLIGGSLTQKTV